jgi:uncharacterized repeat protein (TIGR01451 family)
MPGIVARRGERARRPPAARRCAHSAVAIVAVVGLGAGPSAAADSGARANPEGRSARHPPTKGALPGTADVSVTLADSPDPVSVGQPLTYTVAVHNAGPDAASGVEVANQLPSGVVFARATPTAGACDAPAPGGPVTCSVGALASGSDAQVEIVAYPTDNGSILDAATVSANEVDPTPADAGAETSTAVNGVGCSIVGTSGNDRSLSGTNGDDVICGLGGNDVITGGRGNDRLDGGPGRDVVRGGDGIDQVFGRAGDDDLIGGTGFDLVRYDGAASRVRVDLAEGKATGEGTDALSLIDGIVGSPNGDVLRAGPGANEIYGRGGDDEIAGGRGFDYARFDFAGAGVSVDLTAGAATGGEGSDTIEGIEGVIGSNFADTLLGDAAGNQLGGRSGDDVIRGGRGTDASLYMFATSAVQVDLEASAATGGDGTDALTGIENVVGSPFRDVLKGGAGGNRLSGEAGADTIRGVDGRDALFGNAGADDVGGGRGDDFLDGGLGADRLDGGADVDRCRAGRADRVISCRRVHQPRSAERRSATGRDGEATLRRLPA